MSRINDKFSELKFNKRKAFIPFIMANFPDFNYSKKLLNSLPELGADLIEIGIPFTDPMADGPAIQKAGQRSLSAGTTLVDVLDLVREIRLENDQVPIVLMGYYNPIYAFGVEQFLRQALDTGVDGLIIVDLPPEEDIELCIPAKNVGLDFIRLATPTTSPIRLPTVLKNTSGFIYYVSVAGITGSSNLNVTEVEKEVTRIKSKTDLPVCVGFGIKTPSDAEKISNIADGVVVGSAIVELIDKKKSLDEIKNYIQSLANAVHS